MKKLYVGNISYSTTEDGLRNFFTEYGPIISCKIMTDKFTNESRGFGFVELEDSDKADAAIAQLNDQSLDGKALRVNEAKPLEERGGRSSGGNSRGGNRPSFRGNGRSDNGGRSDRRQSW